ncbi:fatty acid cis/trans isomerase [Desulfopila aestuarii]|uniref:Fatty acid cis/trans isomerase (CTI) n=1 Tax=Desulfopila aestuarii DSM 18488 TaxID=1121416 RepID=A0A1M7YB07_9BACT|nr:fatty acid cis/trans isomerase [Desulfopila aestuarii]SHO49781.1 Fatty acid cis/trans isomerase (CTI) [Desulfopila aestuarii DSM 18488]
MRIANVLLKLMALLLLAGCAGEHMDQAAPLARTEGEIRYLAEIKPILDKRCVVCHSCYNSPCQLKLSSYEGLDRGGSKEAVYNSKRLWAMEPTRLFVDAMTTDEWRDRNFHSVRESTAADGENTSLMFKMLAQKNSEQSSTCSENIKDSCNSFKPEDEKLTCASTVAEMNTYLKKHPNRGMPYGFPPLEEKEFNLIRDWLHDGGRGPTAEEHRARAAVADMDQESVRKWEAFFNAAPDDGELRAKYRMTARYLYEHLFLAHISFDSKSRNFYEIVRSTTPPGEDIRIIPSIRPYDDPGEGPFYYRLRRIYSTIVHKTHMVFELNDAKMARFQELFIEPKWPIAPHVVGFDKRTSANPFKVFQQIPARSRYQFLLDNNHYVIMTFIRGPVCKGQVALNVIHDNFWLFFLDPDYDLSVQRPEFLHNNLDLTILPDEQGSFFSLFKSWMIMRYKQLAYRYVKARQDFYSKTYGPIGLDTRAIWAGNSEEDSPALTIFRHFNSASVHRGVLGDLPRTAWVMDFPLMERIYYALVAGFDVYGSMGHQLGVRLYMDNLRQEGETYFLDFLPKGMRPVLMRSWYGGIDPGKIHYTPSKLPAGMSFTTLDFKREFIENLVQSRFVKAADVTFDENYHTAQQGYPPRLPLQYKSEADYIRGFDSVSAPGTKFFAFMNDYNANLAYVRIRISPTQDQVVSIVVHRWHDNVMTPLNEDERLNSNRDEVDFIRGYVGSYPNYFFDVSLEELPDFLNMLKEYDSRKKEDVAALLRFGVNRAESNFWEKYDWFQQDFDKSDPLRSGLFDLNRYYHLAVKGPAK